MSEKLWEVARRELADDEYPVWFLKHYAGMGRRQGASIIGISAEQFRYRLAKAERKMDAVLGKETAA